MENYHNYILQQVFFAAKLNSKKNKHIHLILLLKKFSPFILYICLWKIISSLICLIQKIVTSYQYVCMIPRTLVDKQCKRVYQMCLLGFGLLVKTQKAMIGRPYLKPKPKTHVQSALGTKQATKLVSCFSIMESR